MLEIASVTTQLSSASDLAAFHARRERFYAIGARLLAAPPDRALLDSARRLLARATGAARELMVALGDSRGAGAAAEHALLFEGAIDLRCRVQPHRDLVAELARLAGLAGRLAVAIQAGDLTEAATISDEQAHVLNDHAGACVTQHARRLIAGGGPFYRAFGLALAVQIADDVRLLGDDAPTR
jgi:hypothetical protein